MKKFFAMVLCLCLCVSLVACGSENPQIDTETSTEGLFESNSDSTESNSDVQTDSVTDSASDSESQTDESNTTTNGRPNISTNTQEEPLPEDKYPNQVMACDQQTGRILVYDMSLIEPGDDLDKAIIWSYDSGSCGGLKFREDTPFGDVIVIAAGESRIVSYPEGKVLWSTTNPGNNPHSIEILPSGNVAIASSTGGTVRFFLASALLEGDTKTAQKYVEKPLEEAHGVLWDPEYNVLWALGKHELVAYAVLGEGAKQTISQVGGMGAKLPTTKNDGHDLSADLSDTRYLYLTTGKNVFRFDKEENKMIENFPQASKLSHANIKGFGNNLNGNFFFCIPNGGKGTPWENDDKAAWCTDEIFFVYWKTKNMMYIQKYKSSTAAFYKCRVFYGKYQ